MFIKPFHGVSGSEPLDHAGLLVVTCRRTEDGSSIRSRHNAQIKRSVEAFLFEHWCNKVRPLAQRREYVVNGFTGKPEEKHDVDDNDTER